MQPFCTHAHARAYVNAFIRDMLPCRLAVLQVYFWPYSGEKTNEKNVSEINPDFIKGMNFHYVDQMQDVLKIALPKK